MNLQKKLEQIENELTESQQELERVNEQLDEKEKAFANVSLKNFSKNQKYLMKIN